MTDARDWRPGRMEEFIGQTQFRKEMAIEVSSSISQGRPLNHQIYGGPGGLGKSTLAEVVAYERGCPKPTILLGKVVTHELLTQVLGNLQSPGYDRDGHLIDPSVAVFHTLVVDECETVSPKVWEQIHHVLEPRPDGRLIMIGREEIGGQVREGPFWVPRFTLIAITNHLGQMLRKSAATVTRFPIRYSFQPYATEELGEIVSQFAGKLGVQIDEEAARLIADRACGVPRQAIHFIKRSLDFTGGRGKWITLDIVNMMFNVLGYDKNGLDKQQVSYLSALISQGGTMGIDGIAVVLGAERETVEQVIEPPLLRRGLVTRRSNGRSITFQGREMVIGVGSSPLHSRRVSI